MTAVPVYTQEVGQRFLEKKGQVAAGETSEEKKQKSQVSHRRRPKLRIPSRLFSRGRLGTLTSRQVETVWETTVEGERVTEWVDWEGGGRGEGRGTEPGNTGRKRHPTLML